MTESLDREIRTLRELYWSDRDPDGRVFATLADAYRRSGDIRQAMELLNEGLDRLPGFVSGHVVAARLYCDAGMMEEASLAARRALELDGENVEAHRSLAQALEARGEDVEAARVRGRLADLEAAEGGETSEVTPAEEEPVSLDELAPDAEEESVSLDELAPDEPEEEPVSLDELAPDEPEEAEAVGVGAVAPEEPTVSLEALAPEEPTESEIEELTSEEPTVSLDELGPEEPDELGEDEPEDELEDDEETVSLDALAPDEPFAPLEEDEEEPDAAEDVTSAFFAPAAEESEDPELRRRIEALTEGGEEADAAGTGAPSDAAVAPASDDQAVADAGWAREGQALDPEVPTPFAWTEKVEDEAVEGDASGPPISDYFQRMLAWGRERSEGDPDAGADDEGGA